MAVRISENLKFVHFYFNHLCSINISNDFSDGNGVFRVCICNFVTFACDFRGLSGVDSASILTLICSVQIYFIVC